jgi:hypothetical protein
MDDHAVNEVGILLKGNMARALTVHHLWFSCIFVHPNLAFTRFARIYLLKSVILFTVGLCGVIFYEENLLNLVTENRAEFSEIVVAITAATIAFTVGCIFYQLLHGAASEITTCCGRKFQLITLICFQLLFILDLSSIYYIIIAYLTFPLFLTLTWLLASWIAIMIEFCVLEPSKVVTYAALWTWLQYRKRRQLNFENPRDGLANPIGRPNLPLITRDAVISAMSPASETA